MNAPAPKSGWSSRQITTMVVAICAAVILAPIGAVAATGSLVNITDPVFAARKARVDTSGRLTVSDQGPVTRTLLYQPSMACDGGSKHFIMDTSGYSSIRVAAYNFGPSQAILDIAPAIGGQFSFPNLWTHTMPHSTASQVTHEISTPPPMTALRVSFCSPSFRIFVYGSR